MGYWVKENEYQCESESELMKLLGLDPETIKGDYAEAFHHMSKKWNQEIIDIRFEK